VIRLRPIRQAQGVGGQLSGHKAPPTSKLTHGHLFDALVSEQQVFTFREIEKAS
jgi:hypothetical protein